MHRSNLKRIVQNHISQDFLLVKLVLSMKLAWALPLLRILGLLEVFLLSIQTRLLLDRRLSKRVMILTMENLPCLKVLKIFNINLNLS